MAIKLVSLNLAGFKDWQSRQQKIVDFIDAENPDVVLFQEVKFDQVRSQYSQSILINRQLKSSMPFTQTTISKFYQPSHGEAFREGLAVLSKFPILSSEVLVLKKQADDNHARIVQNLNLDLGGRELLLSNVHLSNNNYSVEQLEEFLGILESRGESRIIAGDFNIFDLEGTKQLYGDKYKSSIEYMSYTSFPSESVTLDYFLIPKAASFESLEVHEGLSDHAALTVEVDVGEWLH